MGVKESIPIPSHHLLRSRVYQSATATILAMWRSIPCSVHTLQWSSQPALSFSQVSVFFVLFKVGSLLFFSLCFTVSAPVERRMFSRLLRCSFLLLLHHLSFYPFFLLNFSLSF